MAKPLHIEPSAALRAAGAARDHSTTVMSYLDSIDRDVEDLLVTWTGASANAFSEIWADLLDVLRQMAGDLDQLGVDLHAGTHAFIRSDSAWTDGGR